MSEDPLFATKKCCPMKVQDLIGMITKEITIEEACCASIVVHQKAYFRPVSKDDVSRVVYIHYITLQYIRSHLFAL
jgi:hypothetical protein